MSKKSDKKLILIIMVLVMCVTLLIILLFFNNNKDYLVFLEEQNKTTVDEYSVNADMKFNESYESSEISYMYQGEVCNSDLSLLQNAGNEIVARSALWSIEQSFTSFEIISDDYVEDVYTVYFVADNVNYTLVQSMDCVYNIISINNID